MKNRAGFVWFIVGVIPYIITFIYSVYSMFAGVSTCFFSKHYEFCNQVSGLQAFGQVWYMCLYVFFPVYLVFFFFMILGLFKTHYTTITRNRMLLLFGAAPYMLSLVCFLCGCLADTNHSLSYLFSDIFIRHFFIVFADFVGILFIVIALRGLKLLENKKNQ